MFLTSVKNPPSAYLHVAGERLVGVLEAVPVLPSQSERHPRQAEGTVLGYLCVHGLGPGWVRHREVLVQQLLGYDVLEGESESDNDQSASQREEAVSCYR